MEAIKTLVSNKVPILAAIQLVEDYATELEWFIPELVKEVRKIEIVDQLELSKLHLVVNATGTKKGNRVYDNWRKAKVKEFDDLIEEDLNVFERLRRRKGRKTNTLFDQLRYLKDF